MSSVKLYAAIVIGVLASGCAGGDDNPGAADTGPDTGPGVETSVPDPDLGLDPDIGLPPLPDIGPAPDATRDGPVVIKPSDARPDSTVDATPPDSTVDSAPLDSTVDSAPVDTAPVPDGGCTGNAECDDGLTCTTDICGVNGCANVITGNFCVIDSLCIAGGALNPANACEICQPAVAPEAWTNADETGCDDGNPCTHSDLCVVRQCVGTSYSCDDGLGCTADECTGTGPAPDGCTYTLQPGFCAIDGVCVVGADADPSATCHICAPTAATDDWTLQPGFCLIDETCYLESESNPLNGCEVCKTGTAIDSWTVLPGTDPSPHKIVVTEIMANPSAVSDTAGEWLELYNADSVDVDLAGWTLRDDDYNSHRIQGPLVIAPGAYAVLGRNSDDTVNGGVTIDYQYASFLLANSIDEIVLIDDACREVDRVNYTADWPINAGMSLQLDGTSADNANPANWCNAGAAWSGSAGDSGTPGEATVCPPPPDGGVVDASVDSVAPDASVDSGPDSGFVVTCATSGVVVEEVAVGGPDYVALKNYSTGPVDIVGYRLEMYGISSTPTVYTIQASDVSGWLAAGATVYIFEYSAGNLSGDINTGANIPFYDGPPSAANPNAGLLFDATGNLLDYASVGENVGKPDNVTFTALPWPVGFDSDVSSFQRVANNGSCPTFSYLDWYYANLTRP